MNIAGIELLQTELVQPGYFLKAVMNENGLVFFSGKTEHRTVKRGGISYEDDYKGDALAVVVTGGRIEIRKHRDFSVARVRSIIKDLLRHPGLECLQDFSVQYGAEKLT